MKTLPMRPLVMSIIFAAAAPVQAGGAHPWWRGPAPCPPRTVLKGKAPPRGAEVGCAKKRSGVWHGRRTVWFDRCTPAEPCDASKAIPRYHGEYSRGIEHGHWIFWRGSVDNAILEALRTAAASGKNDLAAELEEASRDLKRRSRGSPAADNSSRGRQAGQAIIPTVSIGPGHLDIPDLDMGTTSFGEEDETASPYVQKAVYQAPRRVVRCYEQARARRPGLTGEIVARYMIERNGRVNSVRIVRSTVTETMNQCVKRAIKDGVSLAPHDAPSAIEVISPWRFEAAGNRQGNGRKRR